MSQGFNLCPQGLLLALVLIGAGCLTAYHSLDILKKFKLYTDVFFRQPWGDNEQPGEERKKQTSFTELEENIKHVARYEKENTSSFWENQDKNSSLVDKHHEDKPTAFKEDNTEQSETVMSEDLGETEEPDLKNYCFSSSLLNSAQNKKLQLVLESSNIPFSRTINANTSHLVVGTVNGRTQNTFKFLYAMAQHQTIVSFDWVEQVMTLAGQSVTMVSFA